MHTYCFTWNDAEKNRQVEMSVAYSLAEGAVRIDQITPTKVSFVCAQRGEVKRTIGIHTATGRRLLVEAYYDSAIRTHLKHAILAGSIVDDEDPIEPRIAV
jgi:hypothetical protein